MNKKFSADVFFGIQIIFALIFGLYQAYQLTISTKGFNVSWFIFWYLFTIINLMLAFKAYRQKKSRVTRQIIIVYGIWLVLISINLFILIQGHKFIWNERDSIATTIIIMGLLIIFSTKYFRKNGINDPLIKGWLAFLFKSIPQFLLAYSIYVLRDGSGIHYLTIFAGHILVLTRIGQLLFSLRENKLDKNRKGSMISEFGNELSWIMVTIFWFWF